VKGNISPLGSIILPVYNGEEFLAQSLQSCIDQTHHNLEIIIVNDCSTDTSLAIATSFAANDERIKIINNVINLKLPASLNVGHHAAKGEFISWASDDNMYHHNAIEVLLQQLVETSSDITFSGYQMIEHNGKNRREVQPLTDIHIVLSNCIGASFLYKSVVLSGTMDIMKICIQ